MKEAPLAPCYDPSCQFADAWQLPLSFFPAISRAEAGGCGGASGSVFVGPHCTFNIIKLIAPNPRGLTTASTSLGGQMGQATLPREDYIKTPMTRKSPCDLPCKRHVCKFPRLDSKHKQHHCEISCPDHFPHHLDMSAWMISIGHKKLDWSRKNCPVFFFQPLRMTSYVDHPHPLPLLTAPLVAILPTLLLGGGGEWVHWIHAWKCHVWHANPCLYGTHLCNSNHQSIARAIRSVFLGAQTKCCLEERCVARKKEELVRNNAKTSLNVSMSWLYIMIVNSHIFAITWATVLTDDSELARHKGFQQLSFKTYTFAFFHFHGSKPIFATRWIDVSVHSLSMLGGSNGPGATSSGRFHLGRVAEDSHILTLSSPLPHLYEWLYGREVGGTLLEADQCASDASAGFHAQVVPGPVCAQLGLEIFSQIIFESLLLDLQVCMFPLTPW